MQGRRRGPWTASKLHLAGIMRGTVPALCAFAALLLSSPSARAGDHVRVGATATLANAGFFNDLGVATWSPGADVRVAVPLAAWTSLGLSAGYQHVVREQQLATISVASRDVGHLWLEWSAYAPRLDGRLELGGRLALGLAHAFTHELTGGPAGAIYGTATYWVTSWLAGALELGGGMSIFSTTNDPDGAKPEGLGLFSAKLGVLARF
jgi:hypothetical protein